LPSADFESAASASSAIPALQIQLTQRRLFSLDVGKSLIAQRRSHLTSSIA
jgi:hypothetical protein